MSKMFPTKHNAMLLITIQQKTTIAKMLLNIEHEKSHSTNDPVSGAAGSANHTALHDNSTNLLHARRLNKNRGEMCGVGKNKCFAFTNAIKNYQPCS